MARLDATGINELHARVCRALADPKRLLIDELRDGQRSVGDLAGALGISQPNLSRHLGVLRDPGFVTTERFDSSVHYALTIPKVVRSACSVSSWLEELGPRPGHRLVERRQHTAGIDRLGDRRVGGHQPEHRRLRADHRDVGQAVPSFPCPPRAGS